MNRISAAVRVVFFLTVLFRIVVPRPEYKHFLPLPDDGLTLILFGIIMFLIFGFYAGIQGKHFNAEYDSHYYVPDMKPGWSLYAIIVGVLAILLYLYMFIMEGITNHGNLYLISTILFIICAAFVTMREVVYYKRIKSGVR